MLNELDALINFIQNEYRELTEKWENSEYFTKINLNNNLVCDLLENKLLIDMIISYREFINQNNIKLLMDFKGFNSDDITVNIRTKAKNSIEFKIENYIKNHENGKIPISKCFNDLFGIRLISKEPISFEEILKLVSTKYDSLKCINSTKNEYKATHIYFRKGSYAFQWELQVWNKIDEANNINSHEKYKQDYVRWENENKLKKEVKDNDNTFYIYEQFILFGKKNRFGLYCF